MCNIYGYCRISRKTQSIERQIRNIQKAYPEARIFQEAFTGTKLQGRKELDKLLKVVKSGDTIVFDSASRMSRNSEEAMELYEKLFNADVTLIFLNEPHVNTDTYKKALKNTIPMTGTTVDLILKGINDYLLALAKEQIKIVFDQAEKEVEDLHTRTKQGIETARLNGKQIGQVQGAKLNVKKANISKEKIRKYSADFEGNMSDTDMIEYLKINRNTFYKYKRELKQEIAF